MNQTALLNHIRQLAHEWSPERLEQLAELWAESDTTQTDWYWTRMTQTIPQPERREQAWTLFTVWQKQTPTIPAQSIALALRAAAATAIHHRQNQRLDLVWTGPESGVIPLRRTDQALLELIEGAKARLHIVSFAVYKVDAVKEALVAAAQRGVRLNIYLETPDASEGKMAYDTIRALGSEVRKQAYLYTWPFDKRPLTPDGKYGSLHAKIALADGERLLISSANLTDYALTLNMEMGVMIERGREPGQVEHHLQRLIEQGLFVLVPD